MRVVMDIFIIEEPETTVAPPAQQPKRLDPIDELINASGPIQISYTPRFQNSTIAFADFSRGDRRWIDALVEDISRIAIASPTDNALMKSTASVRTRSHGKQTWQEFIDGLLADKVQRKMDYTEGQLKHLSSLVGLLSKGRKLAGCGSLEFVNSLSSEPLG
jgi:hypothetical protein